MSKRTLCPLTLPLFPERRCSGCGLSKFTTEFHRDRTKASGYHSRCTECLKPYAEQWRSQHSEYGKSYREQWKNNPPDHKPPSLINGRAPYHAKWRSQKGPIYLRDRHRRWTEANPDRYRAMCRNGVRKRRILFNHGIGTHSEAEWLSLCENCAYACLRCGRDDLKLTRDHVVPITKGGSDFIENIQPLCASCNSSKGTRVIDYRPV